MKKNQCSHAGLDKSNMRISWKLFEKCGTKWQIQPKSNNRNADKPKKKRTRNSVWRKRKKIRSEERPLGKTSASNFVSKPRREKLDRKNSCK